MKFLIVLLLTLTGCTVNPSPGSCWVSTDGDVYIKVTGVEYRDTGILANYDYADTRYSAYSQLGSKSRIVGESVIQDGFGDLYRKQIDCTVYESNRSDLNLKQRFTELEGRLKAVEERLDKKRSNEIRK